MRSMLLLLLLALSTSMLSAQDAPSISIAYFGEGITHPGLKVGLNYSFYAWEKTRSKSNGAEKRLHKSFALQPSLGFYYHQDYQTGLFVLPQLAYTRKNAKGAFTSLGVGAGYLRTIVPSVYSLENGAIEKVSGGYNYLLSNYFATFGKDLSVNGKLPLELYAQPQVMNVIPNTRPAIWYFALELGMRLKLETK